MERLADDRRFLVSRIDTVKEDGFFCDIWLVEAMQHSKIFMLLLLGRDQPVVSWFVAPFLGNVLTSQRKRAISEHVSLPERTSASASSLDCFDNNS